jgi:hypothetical protein
VNCNLGVQKFSVQDFGFSWVHPVFDRTTILSVWYIVLLQL